MMWEWAAIHPWMFFWLWISTLFTVYISVAEIARFSQLKETMRQGIEAAVSSAKKLEEEVNTQREILQQIVKNPIRKDLN